MAMKKHEFDKKLAKWAHEQRALVIKVVRFLRERPEEVHSGEELEKRFGSFLRSDYRSHLKNIVVRELDGMPYFFSPKPSLNHHLIEGTVVEHDYCTYRHGPERCTVLGKQGVITRVVEPDMDSEEFEHLYEVQFENTILSLRSDNLRIVSKGEAS